MTTWHFTGQLAIRPATVRITQTHAIRRIEKPRLMATSFRSGVAQCPTV